MIRTGLEDFIRYAKEQFDCDISYKISDEPDTFEKIFGTSFLSESNIEDQIFDIENDFEYEDSFINVSFCHGEKNDEYENSSSLVLAA